MLSAFISPTTQAPLTGVGTSAPDGIITGAITGNTRATQLDNTIQTAQGVMIFTGRDDANIRAQSAERGSVGVFKSDSGTMGVMQYLDYGWETLYTEKEARKKFGLGEKKPKANDKDWSLLTEHTKRWLKEGCLVRIPADADGYSTYYRGRASVPCLEVGEVVDADYNGVGGFKVHFPSYKGYKGWNGKVGDYLEIYIPQED